MSMYRRLRALEERAGDSLEGEQDLVAKEALRRMSTPDLKELREVLDRATGGRETAEDRRVLERFTQLREAVVRGDLTDN